MLPAALCVSGFTLRVPPLVHFLFPPSPSAQHSGAVRAVSGEGNDLRRGEGCVLCYTAHWLPLINASDLWMEEDGSVVTPRAFAWTHFPCLFFSLAIALFCLSSSCLLLTLLFPVFLLSLFPTLLLHGLILTLSLNFCVLSLAVV